MVKARELFAAGWLYGTRLWSRLRDLLDERAEKEKAGWGSRMEYKRRYTNPDEAKRHRAPPEKTKPRSGGR